MGAHHKPNSNRRKLLAAAVCAVLPLALGCGLAAQGRNVDGVRYFQQGQYELAMQRFQEAQRTDPQNPDTYYNQAATLHKTGLQQNNSVVLSQAESMYNTCLGLNANHVDCRRGLAVLLTETGRRDQAFTMLTRWTTESPTSADARVELARLNEEFGNNREAEHYLVEALKLDANNWRAHGALGRQRELAGKYNEAIQNYQRAQQLNPYQPQFAGKVQELTMRLAQNGIPGSGIPAGNTSANTAPGGFGWSNPPGSAPASIIANPMRSPLGTTSATAPFRDLKY